MDTRVASEARKGPRANPNVVSRFESVDDGTLFVSVLAIGEIRNGVELARAKDPAKARALERWLAEWGQAFGDRVIPVNLEVAA